MVPAPPQVARQCPEPLLQRSDKAIQRSRLAHDRSHLRRRFRQHANFIFAEDAGLDGLHHQHALQNAAIDQRNAQERLVGLFAGLPEVLEPRMILDLRDRNRPHLFRHQARQPFVDRHAQVADALAAQSDGRGQHQVGAIRLQQVGRAHVGAKPLGDQGHHVHQRLRRLAALGRQVADFLQAQHGLVISGTHIVRHLFCDLVVSVQSVLPASIRISTCPSITTNDVIVDSSPMDYFTDGPE